MWLDMRGFNSFAGQQCLVDHFFPLVADLVLYIPEETIYVLPGRTAMIRASVYSSDLGDLMVHWYHNYSLINIASDTRYSVSVQESVTSLYTLNIIRVEEDLAGLYEVAIRDGIRSFQNDVVLLVVRSKMNRTLPRVTFLTASQ